MNIKFGEDKSGYGPGVMIELTGNEVARAIDAYLIAHGVHINGARTIRVNGELCKHGSIYVDPSAFVIDDDGVKWNGQGHHG